VIFTPARMARFLAFMGYPISEVEDALRHQYPEYDEPAALAAAAVEEVRESEDYEQTFLAKHEAAIASEHNV
jgi:hypothetical protein